MDTIEKRVFLYSRVSTKGQADNETPIEGQVEGMKRFAEGRGYSIVGEFCDRGVSGQTYKRPMFQKMIETIVADPDQVDAIIVWDMSRFFRDEIYSGLYKRMLKDFDVAVFSSQEPFLEDEDAGEMIGAIIDIINSSYSKKNSKNVKRGIRSTAEKGFYPAGKPPIGYKKEKVPYRETEKNILVPDEVYAPIIRRIFSMCDQGKGVKAIASTLNEEGIRTRSKKEWDTNSIHRVLKNEVYTGSNLWYRTEKKKGKPVPASPDKVVRVEGAFEPIVEKELFDRVQEKLKSRSFVAQHPRITNSDFLLSGLLFCENCGGQVVGRNAKSAAYHYYVCSRKIKKNASRCGMKYVEKESFETFILEQIISQILTPQNFIRLKKMVNEEAENLFGENDTLVRSYNKQIADVDRRLDRLYEAIEKGGIDYADLSPRIKKLAKEKELLLETKANIEEQKANSQWLVSSREIREYVKHLKELLNSSCSNSEKKALLNLFISRIIVKPPRVRIEYHLPRPPIGLRGGVRPIIPSAPPEESPA